VVWVFGDTSLTDELWLAPLFCNKFRNLPLKKQQTWFHFIPQKSARMQTWLPMAKCPFGEPVAECPFLPYYEMKHEHEQVAQIEVIRRKSWMKCAGFTVPVMHELMKTCKTNFL
jgi:hypothetical protein